MNAPLIGIGLYTIHEAAKLTGIKGSDLRRWMFGNQNQPPLWHSQVQDEEIKGLGFNDLIAMRFVHAFRRHGVSLQAIRLASENAKEEFNNPYPFTCSRFRTDGHAIFTEVYESNDEPSLYNLVKKNYAMKEIMDQFLDDGVMLENDMAIKWYPVRDKTGVVLNPQRSFGKPIVEDYGVPNAALYQNYRVEQDVSFVARMFEVSEQAVLDAIEFEEQIAA